MNEIERIKLFCLVDDFSNRFHQMCSQKQMEYTKRKIRKRTFRIPLSEVLTILLPFRRSNDKIFKHFYLNPVKTTLKYLFPHLVGVLKMCSTHL